MNTVFKLVPTERICKLCEVSKPLSEYHKDKSGVLGKKSRCKKCCNDLNREKYPNAERAPRDPGRYKKTFSSYLQRVYGITFEYAKAVLTSQLGLCANRGCGIEVSFEAVNGSKNRAVIDHCHKTGKFRAILCSQCNTVLGSVEKDMNKILGLMEYANKYKAAFENLTKE